MTLLLNSRFQKNPRKGFWLAQFESGTKSVTWRLDDVIWECSRFCWSHLVKARGGSVPKGRRCYCWQKGSLGTKNNGYLPNNLILINMQTLQQIAHTSTVLHNTEQDLFLYIGGMYSTTYLGPLGDHLWTGWVGKGHRINVWRVFFFIDVF